MQILMVVATGIVIFAAWLPAKSNSVVIVFSALYGFASGTFVSLLPALISQISDIRVIGVSIGMTYFVVSFAGLTGNPIGGALLRLHDGEYLGLQLFCGIVVMAAAVFLLMARLRLGGLTKAII